MPGWERWTLTHSSGDPVALGLALALALLVALALVLGLGLALVLALALMLPVLLLGLGLVAASASSVAAVALPVAVDVPDLDGEGDVDPDDPGSRDGDGRADRDGDGEPDDREGDGEAVVSGLRVTLAEGEEPVGGSVVAGDWVAVGLVEGEGDGEGEGEDADEGEGLGVGVLETGSAWHTVSVLAVVVIGAAWALPSRPRVRKLPLSKVTAATLTCAKRISSPVHAARQGYRVLSGFGGD